MIRHTVVAIALFCAAGTALAQTPSATPAPRWHGGHHAMEQRMEQQMEQHQMKRLTLLLDLTAAQQQKVEDILAAEHSRMREAMEQAMRQVRDTHRAVRKDTTAKLSAVLSPTQMKKFDALMEPGMMHGMMMHGMMMHGMMMHGMMMHDMMMHRMGHGMGMAPPPPPPGQGPGPQ